MNPRPINISYTAENDRLRVWFLDVEQDYPDVHLLSLEGPVGEFRHRETGAITGWEIFDFVRFAKLGYYWVPTDVDEPAGEFVYEGGPSDSLSGVLKRYYEERIVQHAA